MKPKSAWWKTISSQKCIWSVKTNTRLPDPSTKAGSPGCLPGMQSAFVDIGLERDAFLYVSDFMELEAEDGELDDTAGHAGGH